jgi:uncharacterized protein (TIRG00374 family)
MLHGVRTMRTIKTVLLVLGALLLVTVVYHVGTQPIVETLRRLSWWQFVLICVPYGVISAVDTLGWRFAFARDRSGFARLYGARVAGEALNIVTAVGSLGGEAAKAWLVRDDVSYEESVPAIIIAKTTITMAQAIFLLIGIVVAWASLDVSSEILRAMLWLLVVEVLAVAGFFGFQVVGLVAHAGRLLERFRLVRDASRATQLDAALRHYYRNEWRRFSLSVGFHVVGWLLGALEAWVMLWALGIDTDVFTATVIEALGSGVRFATFLVPASLGAFEGANAAAFGVLGFGAAAGIAFSLVRRAREVVWILIGLGFLFGMRGRRAAVRA